MGVYKENRIGMFRLHREAFLKFEQESFEAIFEKFIPLHIFSNFATNTLEYQGFHPAFLPRPEGLILLQYEAVIQMTNEKIWKREWKLIDDMPDQEILSRTPDDMHTRHKSFF